LNIGNEVTFYGRTFLIIDCDAFSRAFLTKLGMSVGEPLPLPEDPYTTVREVRSLPASAVSQQSP
jgi:hypothetical protein